jgi:hypothetical protein
MRRITMRRYRSSQIWTFILGNFTRRERVFILFVVVVITDISYVFNQSVCDMHCLLRVLLKGELQSVMWD